MYYLQINCKLNLINFSGVQPPSNPAPHHLDNIGKIKLSLGPLKESIQSMFKIASVVLQKNSAVDNLKRDTCDPPKFEKHLEDFYSICDSIELHLVTAANCIQQQNSSHKYLPGNLENSMNLVSYGNYLTTVNLQFCKLIILLNINKFQARGHVSNAKDLHDTFISAAQNISTSD